ncbi:MAG: hypothetical protein GXP54_09730 [Deltaproteobacteria bacterium]|nr:hypothetical protein [Deltaproteobacteria bacterium]
MDELMSRLALIRAQVEADAPRNRFSSRLVGMLLLLALLVLLPVLFSGPCGTGRANAGEPRAELMKRAYDVKASGGILYSAVEYGLVMWDISGTGPPVRLGAIEIPGSAVSVTVSGRTAFVCAGPYGLYVIDVSNPRAPKLLSRLDTPGSAMQIAVSGRMGYLADGTVGTAVLDLKDLRAPVEVGRLGTADYVRGVALAKDTLLTAEDRGGLNIRRLTHRKGGLRRPGPAVNVPVSGQARAVLVHGGRAWVAAGSGGLSVVELRPGRRPHVVVTVSTGGVARGLCVQRDGFLLVSAGSAGVKVFDLSRPDGTADVGGFALPNASAIRIAAAGNRAFVAYDFMGIRVLDMSKPFRPVQIQ